MLWFLKKYRQHNKNSIFSQTALIWYEPIMRHMVRVLFVMTSSNGNTVRVTGLCEGNPPVAGGFPSQRPVTRSFDDFFDVRLNKRLNKQSICWRHYNAHHYATVMCGWEPRVVTSQAWTRQSHECHITSEVTSLVTTQIKQNITKPCE